MAFAIWAISMFAFLAACGTLETRTGLEREDSKIAVLEGYWRYLFLYIEQFGISSVDDKRANGLLGYVGSVSLPPGGHWIELTLQRNYGTIAKCAFELEFDAEAHYQIKALKADGLLAHPLSSPYKGSIRIEVAASGKPAQTLDIAAVCTRGELLCRKDSDCSPNYPCHTEPGFDFGTCKPHDR
jgi:hypothetical protein